MNDIVGGDEEADLGISGQDQGFVNLQQVVFALAFGVVNLALGGTQVGKEGDILTVFVQVLVLPLPLVARDQHIHVGIVVVVDVEQGEGGGIRHADKNEERNNRPGDLYLGALVESRGRDALGLAVVDDRVKHHTEHTDTDDGADAENDHVQAVDLLPNFCHPGRHVELVDFPLCSQGDGTEQHQHRTEREPE